MTGGAGSRPRPAAPMTPPRWTPSPESRPDRSGRRQRLGMRSADRLRLHTWFGGRLPCRHMVPRSSPETAPTSVRMRCHTFASSARGWSLRWTPSGHTATVIAMTHPPISAEAEANAERARVAFVEHNWSEAIELLRAADAGGALTAADLDAYGETAWWMGRLGEAIEVRERAFAAHKAAGDPRRAAATALNWKSRRLN